MPLTIQCRHCGSTIQPTEEDRGHEVYCDSCGRANQIPAKVDAEEPPDAKPAAAHETPQHNRPNAAVGSGDADSGRQSVFSAEAALQWQHQVVAKERCLCGVEVPVRVEDFGGTVYCPSCGTEIRVGEALHGGKFHVAQAGTPPDAAALAESGEPRRVSRSAVAAGGVVLLVAAAVAGYLAWHSLWKHPVVEQEPLGRVLENRTSTGQAPGENLPTPSEPEITLSGIEHLLDHSDPVAALVQARFWQDTLSRRETAGEDPRVSKLREVVEALEKKLTPAEATAEEVRRFHSAVDELADALKGRNLPAARAAMRSAEDLLRQHPDELAGFRKRFEMLKKRLAEEEKFSAEVERIADLLRQADGHQAAGRVTEALEANARARFLALVTLLSKSEAEALDAMERELISRLRLARGKRAVDDAHALAAVGDVPARNREVRRALALLPGLPESRVAPLVESLQPWADEARLAPDDDSPEAPSSKLARQIRRRDAYESVLEHYGAGESLELAAACKDLAALPAADNSGSLQETFQGMLFDALERDVRRIITLSESTEDGNTSADQASRARRLLDQAAPWKDNPRWKALDALVRAAPSRR